MRRLLVLLVVACGLTVATTSSASSEAPSPVRIVVSTNSPVTVGEAIVIRGTVRNARPGTRVVLQKRVDGRWVKDSAKRLGTARAFRFTHRTTVSVVRYYRLVSERYGAQPSAVSRTLKVVAQRRAAKVSARVVYEPGWRESILANVTGTVAGGRPDASVLLQYFDGGQWFTHARTVAKGGRFAFRHAYLPNRATRLRVVKPQDRYSRAAASPAFGAAVTAPRMSVEQSATLIIPASGIGHVRFWAQGGSDLLLSTTPVRSGYLTSPDGSLASELNAPPANRVSLPKQTGLYVYDFSGEPGSAVTLSVTRTRHITAQTDGPPTTLESWHPRAYEVDFEAEKGDVIAAASTLPDGSDCKVSVWTLETSAGDNPQPLGNATWAINTNGRHKLVLVTQCSSTSPIELSILRAQRVSGSLEEPVAVPATRPGRPTIVEFDAPANQQINLDYRRVGSHDWRWRAVGGRFSGSDAIFQERFMTTSAGRHELLIPSRGDWIDTKPVAICAARTYPADVDGEPITIDDWTCAERAIIVEFAAEAGDVIGVEKLATGLFEGCSYRLVGGSDSFSCLSMKPLAVTGRYRAVFVADSMSPVIGKVHVWRAARANAAVDGDPVEVRIDAPRQRALIDVDVTEPGDLTATFDLSGLGAGAHFDAEVWDPDGNKIPRTYDRETSTIKFDAAAPGRYQLRFRTGADRTGTFTATVTSG